MKTMLIALACVVSVASYGRSFQDTVPASSNYPQQSYRALFRITSSEIENLPFTSIMEVINGAFPFVFSDPPAAGSYNFIYDGRLLVNVNAINISQIASIEYYPVAFDLAGGSLSARGTFVITSKNTAVSGQGLTIRSQGGIIIPGSASFGIDPGGSFKSSGNNEYFMHHEIGYGFNRNKLSFRLSGSFTRNAVPEYNFTIPALGREDYHDKFNRARFSADAAYAINTKFKVSAGAFFNQQRTTHGREVTLVNAATGSNTNTQREPQYWSAHAALEFRPAKNIKNVLQFEYARTRQDSTSDVFSRLADPSLNRTTAYVDKLKDRSFAITNSFTASIFHGNKFSLTGELLFRYFEQKLKNDFTQVVRLQNGSPISAASGSSRSEAKSVALMPRLSALIAQQLFVTAGLAYDDWQNGPSAYFPYGGETDLETLFPYAGLRWSMRAPKGKLSSLSVHTTYGKSWQSPRETNLLDVYKSPFEVPAGFFEPGSKDATVNWISGVDIGLANRFNFSINYINGSAFPLISRAAPTPFSVVAYREIRRSGLSAGVHAKILEKDKYNLQVKSILFYDYYELKDTANQQLLKLYNPLLNEKGQWYGTAQVMAAMGRFSLQAIALFRFKEVNTVFAPFQGYQQQEFSNHGLNFVSAGYDIPLKRGTFRQVELAVQARNLVTLKETPSSLYYGSKYIGLGVKVAI